MKFGCCIGLGGYIPPEARNAGKTTADSYQEQVEWLIRQIGYLKSTGYDYVEFPVGMVAGVSDDAYVYLRTALRRATLRPEAFNCFIPANLKIVGPDVDANALKAYVELAAARTSECGAKVIVFGSGGARNTPDGFSTLKAESQIMDFLNMAAKIAFQRDLVIAIEPLNRHECNSINLVADAVEMAKDLSNPSIKVLADFYHIDEEKESFDTIESACELLAHVHVADTGRLNPGSGTYDYNGFFHALHAIDYQGRISIECNLRDFEKDTANSIRFMKSMWSQY